MKRYLGLTSPMRLIAVGIVGLLAALASLAANAAEEETFELNTTPKGTYRLETAGGDETQVFVVLKSSGQRERLPDASSEDPTECTVIYAGSPDENWIFRTEGWRHHGVQGRQLYHHENGAKFVYYKGRNGSRRRSWRKRLRRVDLGRRIFTSNELRTFSRTI